MPIRILSFDEVIDGLISSNQPYFTNYFAMYSSWYGGIITDPALMMVPVDDHLVHRGDGVFEAIACRNRKIYALDRHLDRLDSGAAAYALKVPVDRPGMVEIIRETIRAGNNGTCMVRLFVSRGPGGFSASPYDSIASQVYVVITSLQPPTQDKYEQGVVLVTSNIPLKKDYFATTKTCNYLPNVLMKKASVDAGADFPVSIDEQGFLGEGATENIGIVTKKGEFLIPRFRRILKGITVTRAVELARTLIGRELTAVAEADITPEQAYAAAEMLVFGTSVHILPVVKYDGHRIGDGRPGPAYKKLLELFIEDESNNPEILTEV